MTSESCLRYSYVGYSEQLGYIYSDRIFDTHMENVDTGKEKKSDEMIDRDLLEKLAKVHRLLNRRLLISNRKEDPDKSISRLQLNILTLLDNNGSMSSGEISDNLMIRKPHMTVLKNKLMRRSLIKLEKSDKDRRVIKINITPKGREIRQYYADLVFLNLRDELSNLKKRDIKNLYNSVQKLSEIHDKLEK